LLAPHLEKYSKGLKDTGGQGSDYAQGYFGLIPPIEERKMSAQEWKERIVESAKSIGTYREEFDDIIAMLSEILDRRDKIKKQFTDEGEIFLVKKVSDRGSVNYSKNPLLATLENCEAQALTFWREIGLTPRGLKQIDEIAAKSGKSQGGELAKILQELS
jgi:hypothetical protein